MIAEIVKRKRKDNYLEIILKSKPEVVHFMLFTSSDPGKITNHFGLCFLIFQMGITSPCFFHGAIVRFGKKYESDLKIM